MNDPRSVWTQQPPDGAQAVSMADGIGGFLAAHASVATIAVIAIVGLFLCHGDQE